jgi:hypothetical protein
MAKEENFSLYYARWLRERDTLLKLWQRLVERSARLLLTGVHGMGVRRANIAAGAEASGKQPSLPRDTACPACPGTARNAGARQNTSRSVLPFSHVKERLIDERKTPA